MGILMQILGLVMAVAFAFFHLSMGEAEANTW